MRGHYLTDPIAHLQYQIRCHAATFEGTLRNGKTQVLVKTDDLLALQATPIPFFEVRVVKRIDHEVTDINAPVKVEFYKNYKDHLDGWTAVMLRPLNNFEILKYNKLLKELRYL